MNSRIQEIENRFHSCADGKFSTSEKGMVSTQSSYASDIGAEILSQGGNAIDAACAAALALGVSEPQASGLGGQTMMLIHQDNTTVAIDGSSRAPSLAHVSSVYKSDRISGYRASTVPSTPAVLWYIQNKYGSMNWHNIVGPSIELAKSGYTITELQSKLLKREQDSFVKIDSQSGLEYFYRNGEPYEAGELFKQEDLAKTLQRISDFGIEDFYRGKISRIIDADMRENGGLVRLDDLALIPLPIEREPLIRSFRGLDIATMPPPGSGRTLLFALMMLDLIPEDVVMSDPLKEDLLFIRVLRKAFFERSDRPFNANFFSQTEDSQDMLDSVYARECLVEILNNVDKNVLPFIPTEDEVAGETTHLSVMDNNCMAVSLTQSIERVYGSKAAASGLGFLYNNYLYDFNDTHPAHPFYLRPNAVPWATVAPSMVFDEGKLWMTLGSPGSERIVSSLARFLINIIDKGMSLDEAVSAPRLHCSLGGRVSLEADDFPESLIPFLEYKGFRIDKRESRAFYLGCIQAIIRKQDGSGFQGVADIRRDGKASGVL